MCVCVCVCVRERERERERDRAGGVREGVDAFLCYKQQEIVGNGAGSDLRCAVGTVKSPVRFSFNSNYLTMNNKLKDL